MATYISEEGARMLDSIRVRWSSLPAQGVAPVRQTACLPSDECGCPEELWVIDGIEALIHFEADGSGEMHIDAGDWQDEKRVQCATMAGLRAELFAWMAEIASLPEIPSATQEAREQ